MNYIRGAVNAISAPYQYYKELPPINPSTLTGAIDVIVIQRPAADGDTELSCSPFHVRFGKWQVLRPAEKKVNVSVNGNLIPFNMKIGDAGEAFFVFETEEDVPPDLITSPILQPTTPSGPVPDIPSDRFGSKTVPDNALEELDQSLTQEAANQEPDYLDLDAHGGMSSHQVIDEEQLGHYNTTPTQTYRMPSFLRKSSSRGTINQRSSLPSSPDALHPARAPMPEMDDQDRLVDQALNRLQANGHLPEVEYHHDVALDMEGYHSDYHDRHEREKFQSTIRSSERDDFGDFQLPSNRQGNANRPAFHESPPRASSSYSQGSNVPSHQESPIGFSSFRATSEPPPDVMDEIETPNSPNSDVVVSDLLQSVPSPLEPQQQEYSWEWGGFPQPSPIQMTFSKSGRIERSGPIFGTGPWSKNPPTLKTGRLSRMHLTLLHDAGEQSDDQTFLDRGRNRGEREHGRSHSVPPELQGSPPRRKGRNRRKWKEYEDFEEEVLGDGNLPQDEQESETTDVGPQKSNTREMENTGDFGIGGIVTASKGDPTKFVLLMEGRKMGFQLSLAPSLVVLSSHNLQQDKGENDDQERGRKAEDGKGFLSKQHVPRGNGTKDEVETASLFDQGLINFDQFTSDETVLLDPNLVVRWVGIDQYITHNDGSPLMGALIHWRNATLRKRAAGYPLRPASPSNDESIPASPTPTEPESPPISVPQSLNAKSDDSKAANAPSTHNPSKSELPEQPYQQAEDENVRNPKTTSGRNPTSSSWVQWWGRSRHKGSGGTFGKNASRSNVDSISSVPSEFDESQDNPLLKLSRPNHVVEEERRSKTQEEAVAGDIPNGTAQDQSQPSQIRKTKFAKTLRLTSDQLKSLNLRRGANTITFSLSTTGAVAATARIFVWDYTDLVVVSDIDGTITKSDGLGHVFAMIGRDWTHLGVAKLYTDITRNGYKIMYLTSRAIGQADATRDYLKGIKQNDYQLPEGPVIMSPDRLMASLHREVIMRKPEVFKMACLRDIQRLFGEHAKNPFYAGFGNRITDALSYRSVNVPSARIFTIDSSGEVKMELLELAGYKSSYIHMTDLVDQMFPPIHRKWTPEFTDFNYWKAPVQDFPLPDLSPPSPALSARSDTSNQSTLARLRNFSLVGSRQNAETSPSRPDSNEYRSTHLRQISSFERLSSTLGFMSNVNNVRRSASPGSQSSHGLDDEDEDASSDAGGAGRRQRRQSMTSMPGSLNDEDMHFDDEEAGNGEYGNEEEDEEPLDEEATDEAFDEDLLAAGEMQKVPFL